MQAEIFKARTEVAQQMGQKAEALRKEAEVEAYHCEGHIGCLMRVVEILDSHLAHHKESVASGDVEPGQGADLASGLITAREVAEALKRTAETNLAQARGRLNQAERTLDMMEAVFTADVAAARQVEQRGEVEILGPLDESRHPGPSIADQRRQEEAEHGGDTRPQGADGLP